MPMPINVRLWLIIYLYLESKLSSSEDFLLCILDVAALHKNKKFND